MASKSADFEIIDLTPENFAEYGVCGYKDVKKHLELQRKIEWFNKYYPKGLRIKILLAKPGGYQGMLEYIPGEYAHRPVNAEGYLFIHCVFVGFKKEFKGRGFASSLIRECIQEAKEKDMNGIAVVTRKGSFMANKHIFQKMDFTVVDKAKPDFELMSLELKSGTVKPSFKPMHPEKYKEGLTIIRSAQCPYSVKNVDAIIKTAENMDLPVNLVELEDADSAQTSPCPFGTFCIIYNGRVISHHPISNTRFENIMKSQSH